MCVSTIIGTYTYHQHWLGNMCPLDDARLIECVIFVLYVAVNDCQPKIW